MVQFFVCLCVFTGVFYASDEKNTVVHTEETYAADVSESAFDYLITITGAQPVQENSDDIISVTSTASVHDSVAQESYHNVEEEFFSTPENLEHERHADPTTTLHASHNSLHEPFDAGDGGHETPLGNFTPSLPPSSSATTEESQPHTHTSLSLSERFKDGARSSEWERALADIPENVKVVPYSCIQSFKRFYTSFSDGLSLFSLIFYGVSGVASGIGGIDYLSNNAFLPEDDMVTIVGLGLIGAVLFKYLWVSSSYVKKMDQKRLISYERRIAEMDTERFSNAQLIERFERANIFLMYPSYSMIKTRQLLFNFVCCSETISSTLLAISGSFFAVSSVSGITGKDLLHIGSQDSYLAMSQGGALAYAIMLILRTKAGELKERCEAWLTVQELAKLYLIQISGIEKDDVYKDVHKLDDHLKRGRANLLIA